MVLKQIKLIKLVCFNLVFIIVFACNQFHSQDITSSSMQNTPIVSASRVVVLGFKPALKSGQNSVAVLNSLSEIVSGAEPVSKSASDKLSQMLFSILINKKDCEFIGPEETGHLADGSAYNNLEENKIDVIQTIGKSFSAEAVLTGHLYRWQERAGTEMSVKKPASVAFDLYLIESKSGAILWKGRYNKKQISLSENLLEMKNFLKNKGKWISVEKLAEIGVEELIKEMPLKGK